MTSKLWEIKKCVLPQHADHAGVMWHGSYCSWLEEARIEILSCVGLSYYQLSSSGIEMPVVSLKIEYKKSINHGDEVLLRTSLLEKCGIRYSWKTEFIKNDNIIAAVGKVELVLVNKIDNHFKIIRKCPDFLNDAFYKIRKGPID